MKGYEHYGALSPEDKERFNAEIENGWFDHKKAGEKFIAKLNGDVAGKKIMKAEISGERGTQVRLLLEDGSVVEIASEQCDCGRGCTASASINRIRIQDYDPARCIC